MKSEGGKQIQYANTYIYIHTHNGESVEKREPSCTVGGNVNSYSRYGEQYGGSLKN